MNRAALSALLFAVPALAAAQPYPQGPRAEDRRELRQDRRELADDRRDAFDVRQLLARWDGARGRRERAEVEADVARMLQREIQEGRAELARDRGELGHDARDLRGERRDAGFDRRDLRDDRRDLRDDRRDLRDDRRDLARVTAIDGEWTRLRGRMDRRAVERKRNLLVELSHMARAELREDRGERREDRRELREDRREAIEHQR